MHIVKEKLLAFTTAQVRFLITLYKIPGSCLGNKKLIAYCHRFYLSYGHALLVIRAGKLGPPVVIRDENRDRYDPLASQLLYPLSSLGIFIDAGIHDTDLSLAIWGLERDLGWALMGKRVGYAELEEKVIWIMALGLWSLLPLLVQRHNDVQFVSGGYFDVKPFTTEVA